MADERRLKQAIFKLLTNAIKFTPSGGQITVKAILKEKEQNAPSPASPPEKLLGLVVCDTGVGMNLDEQAFLFKLFDRPFNSFSRKGGAGLGLPLVKSLIELHGGSIEIDSEEGVGTTIICWIPLVIPSPEEMEEAQNFKAPGTLESKTPGTQEAEGTFNEDIENALIDSRFLPFSSQDFLPLT